jgi:hypothetical protein
MQFALLFSTVPLLNKLNCKKRKDKTNWPSGKAHHIMSVIVKEFEPEDTMAKIEMEHALATQMNCWMSLHQTNADTRWS